MSAIIQLRRDTSANWVAANPVLAIGEIGINTDDLSYKIGDGIKNWSALSYRELTGLFSAGLTLENILPPSVPASNKLALWAQSVGGRIMLRMMGPSGVDTTLQPALFGNGIVLVAPATTTTFSVIGTPVPTAVGTVATPVITAGVSLRSSTRRTTVTSAATANAASELRLSTTPFYRGEVFGNSTAGGFFFVTRHSMSTMVSLQRTAIGLSSASTAFAVTLNPSSLTNCILLANDSADTNMQIMYNDAAGTCTKIDLGVDFPAASITAMYELVLFCRPNGDDVFYRVSDLSTGKTAVGTISTDLPAKTTLLYPHLYANNGGTAASVVLEFMRLYIETDY